MLRHAVLSHSGLFGPFPCEARLPYLFCTFRKVITVSLASLAGQMGLWL